MPEEKRYFVSAYVEDPDDKDLHYDIYYNLKDAQDAINSLTHVLVPYYLVLGNFADLTRFALQTMHVTDHLTDKHFEGANDHIFRIDAAGCPVPTSFFLSDYLPANLDENGVHPETGIKYVCQTDHKDHVHSTSLKDSYRDNVHIKTDSAGEQSNGDYEGRSSN